MIVYSELWRSYGIVVQKDKEFIIGFEKIKTNVILIVASSDSRLIGMKLGSNPNDRKVEGLMLE